MATPKFPRSRSRGTVDEPFRSPRYRNDPVEPIPPNLRNQPGPGKLGTVPPAPETPVGVMGGKPRRKNA